MPSDEQTDRSYRYGDWKNHPYSVVSSFLVFAVVGFTIGAMVWLVSGQYVTPVWPYTALARAMMAIGLGGFFASRAARATILHLDEKLNHQELREGARMKMTPAGEFTGETPKYWWFIAGLTVGLVLNHFIPFFPLL